MYEFPELVGWSLTVNEIAVGVYRGIGVHEYGATISITESNPDTVVERLNAEIINRTNSSHEPL